MTCVGFITRCPNFKNELLLKNRLNKKNEAVFFVPIESSESLAHSIVKNQITGIIFYFDEFLFHHQKKINEALPYFRNLPIVVLAKNYTFSVRENWKNSENIFFLEYPLQINLIDRLLGKVEGNHLRHRRFERVRPNYRGFIESCSHSLPVEIINLSRGGICVKSNHFNFPSPTQVKLFSKRNNSFYSLAARLVWRQKPFYGFEFLKDRAA